MASIGETVGFADYTTFMATDKYIRENPEADPELDQRDRQGDEVDRGRADRRDSPRRLSSSFRA